MATENELVICAECKHSISSKYMGFVLMYVMVLHEYCNKFSLVKSLHGIGSYLKLKIFLSLYLSSSLHEGCVNPWL